MVPRPPHPLTWPKQLGEAAYHGVIGEYVRTVTPHTEADPAAVLIQSLVCLGNAMGRNPHFFVEQTRHGTNLFTAVVGATSLARKGTALDRARGLVGAADEMWGAANEGDGGLSTSEGLIAAVRDGRPTLEGGDSGVEDKRLLAAMGEFGETLSRMRRDGNPLSSTLRNAWDGKPLRLRTRKQPLTATGAHISVIGHITVADLETLLASAEVSNGFANRFLWVLARRSQELPFGGSLKAEDLNDIVAATRASLFWAQEEERRIEFDKSARRGWRELYHELGQTEGGRLGAVTDRAEAQVRRLALIYAVMDRSAAVGVPHLEAAVEVWRYCEESAAYVFADEPPTDLERRIVRFLSRRQDWFSRSTVQRFFKGKVKSYRLDSAVASLKEQELIEERTVPTDGRPRIEYRLKR